MAFNPGMSAGGQGSIGQGLLGAREDLADYIAVVDAKSTPFVSMAPKGKDIGNMQFSWQVDSYASPQLGGVVDGADVSLTAPDDSTVATNTSSVSNANGARVRFWNCGQVFRRHHRTGFVADTLTIAGVGTSETARAVAKRLVEIKRDMEAVFTNVNLAAQQEVSGGAGAASPYITASLGQWLTVTPAAAPVLGKPTAAFSTPSASIDTTATASLTEANIQAVLTSIYGQTGVFRDYDMICGTTLKRAFTALTVPFTGTGSASTPNSLVIGAGGVSTTAVRTFNTELSGDVYKSSIDIFEGDFGTIKLHPTTFLMDNAGVAKAFKGYVIPFDMTEIRYVKLPEVKDLPDNGGGPIKMIQAIAGLVVKNPLGFGMFNATS